MVCLVSRPCCLGEGGYQLEYARQPDERCIRSIFLSGTEVKQPLRFGCGDVKGLQKDRRRVVVEGQRTRKRVVGLA